MAAKKLTLKQSISKWWNNVKKQWGYRYNRLKSKNWKADRQAWKNKWKERFKKWKPYVIVTAWYTLLGYLLVGWWSGDYSWKTVTFAFALYFLYEKLRDDYIELLEVKSIYKKENDK